MKRSVLYDLHRILSSQSTFFEATRLVARARESSPTLATLVGKLKAPADVGGVPHYEH
jgi:hypothetical protein